MNRRENPMAEAATPGIEVRLMGFVDLPGRQERDPANLLDLTDTGRSPWTLHTFAALNTAWMKVTVGYA